MQSIEHVTFRLVSGTDRAAFVTAAQATDPVVRRQPGFVARILTEGADGIWSDIVTWASHADAMAVTRHLPALRRAICLRERVELGYLNASGIASERPVRPLVLEFWGRVWTLATGGEPRQNFRSFRIVRITTLRLTEEAFPDDPGKTLTNWRQLHCI